MNDDGRTEVASLIERLENPSGTRCPVRDGDRRCLGNAAHDTHYFLPDEDIQEAALGHLLKAALGGSVPSPGAYVAGVFEQRYDDDGWPLSGITVSPVAASPVPPVVPDSDERWTRGWVLGPKIHEPSGLGVVPDKPALALCPDCGAHASRFPEHNDGCPNGYYADVPAVTDDEAAKYLEEKYGKWPYEPVPVVDFPSQGDNAVDPPWYVAGMGIWHDDDGLPLWKAQSYARAAVAALRSAGFLIVHHTKET